MRKHIAPLIVGLACTVLASLQAQAGQCFRDAKSTFRECKSSCKTDLLDDKAGCLNVTPGCFLACRDGKSECIADAEQPLTDCIAGCNAPLDQARTDCKGQCGCGAPDNRCGFNPCYVQCLDPFQATAFSCRDGCRDTFKLDANAQALIAACKTGFKACVGACPAP